MYEVINDEEINLLMLNYEYPPLGGGAGNASYYLLKEISKCPRIKIDLVTTSTNNFRTEKLTEDVTIHFLDINKKEKSLHYQTNKDILVYFFKAYSYVKALKKHKKFDLCHAFFGIPCGFIALLLGIPYIVSLRGSDVPYFNKRFYWLDKLVFKKLSRVIWKRALKVVANSEGLKELAQKTAPNQEIRVINNGVDLELFYPPEKKAISSKVKLISTGRLIERKGYAYLIEALKNNKNVELTLIGEGNIKELLESLALKNTVSVKFLGRIAHEKIPEYLRFADVFVLPSLNEGMSNAILEAMACGLPVITTNVGGSSELVKGNGFIVNKASAVSLKHAIKEYSKNKTLIKKHGEKSRCIAEYTSWNKVAKDYSSLYFRCKLKYKL